MSFRVLVVDDFPPAFDSIKSELERSEEDSRRDGGLELDRSLSPEDAASRVKEDFDLVLADLDFDRSPNTSPPKRISLGRITALFDAIKAFRKQPGRQASSPVIVWSDYSAQMMTELQPYQELLYDIWDKSTALPTYVAWRLRRVAQELRSQRPTRVLLRELEGLPRCGGFHDNVVRMAKEYSSETNEWGQLVKAGEVIKDIGHSFGVVEGEVVEKLWDVIVKWEPLGRAANPAIRGHARHLVNVYWMGYLLINHPGLGSWVQNAWQHLRKNRGTLSTLDLPADESFNRIWFFGGLFHDLGGAVEKAGDVESTLATLLSVFPMVEKAALHRKLDLSPTVDKDVLLMVGAYSSQPLRDALTGVWTASKSKGHPDQGIVTALTLNSLLGNTGHAEMVREAARAAAIHNAVPNALPPAVPGTGPAPVANAPVGKLAVEWKSDPIGCLLLVCDQLQTWDRERYDEVAKRYLVLPAEAELDALKVSVDSRPRVQLAVNYLPSLKVLRNPDLLADCETDLGRILDKFPLRVLGSIQGDWPFVLDLRLSLGGKSIRNRTFGD